MKLGFIGCGNMAKAIMGGIIQNGIVPAEDIVASDVSAAALDAASKALGIHTTQKNDEAARQSETLFLAVKPQYYAEVIRGIAGSVGEDRLVITIAPGKTLEWLENMFGRPVHLVRTMPNTPAMVGEGITAACPNRYVTEEEKQRTLTLLSGFGKAELVPEHLMDAVVSVSGSSPAYVFMMIEAMADAAVADGMPRAQAYTFAAQAVMGSAKMVLETGKHPGELKDMVCSPAGTTIEAVRVLEEKGFRSSIMEAMKACTQKARSM